MRKLLTSLIIIAAIACSLLLTAVIPLSVSAHTASAVSSGTTAFPPRGPSPFMSTTNLKRGPWGNFYFSPTYTSAHVFATFFIVNETGRNIILTDNANPIGVLHAGGIYRTVFYSAGSYQFNDIQQNIRVPLYVYAYWR